MNTSIKDLIPPLFFRSLQQLKPKKYGWLGNYKNWDAARKDSEGYAASNIVEQIDAAIDAVKEGKAAYERDGVLFSEEEFNWPFIALLMQLAAKNEGQLKLIDFGGSLGSSYFQNLHFFHALQQVDWKVVEQNHFVEIGKKKHENPQLSFHFSISDALQQSAVDNILFSSVLQYLEQPYVLLEECFSHNFQTILIDRMPFNRKAEDRICVQRVPPEIYNASYPCHLLNLSSFIAFFEEHGYECTLEFDALDGKGNDYEYKGFVFEKK